MWNGSGNGLYVKKSEGCVSLKIALAYERSLHFEKVTSEQADRVFRLKESDITQEDIRAFQDYLFWKICEIAAEVSLPLQCHTGMGQIIDTNVLQLNNVIHGTVEESYGSLLAFRFSLCKVLSEKIADGYLSVNNAKDIINKILFDNAQNIYF